MCIFCCDKVFIIYRTWLLVINKQRPSFLISHFQIFLPVYFPCIRSSSHSIKNNKVCPFNSVEQSITQHDFFHTCKKSEFIQFIFCVSGGAQYYSFLQPLHSLLTICKAICPHPVEPSYRSEE